MEIRIGIGLPLSWQYCPVDFFNSFTLMNKMDGELIQSASGPIDGMRNNIVRRALESDRTHLIFLDADMLYPKDTIPRLLSHDKAIIGALTFKRWPPFNPLLFVGVRSELELMDPYPEDLVEVTATGTGCLMIKTEVFDNMEYPWFQFTMTDDKRPIGEDIGFCYKAADLGYNIYVDTTVKTEHLAQQRVNENMWKLNRSLIESKQGKFNF